LNLITAAAGNYPKVGDAPEQQGLRRAIQKFQDGKMTAEELEAVAKEVTAAAIREQEAAGLDVVTDGLIRWEDGQTYLARKLGGFEIGGLIRYFDTNTYYRRPIVAGRVRWRVPITVDDYRFAVTKATKPVKAVLTGPYTLAMLSEDRTYRDLRALVEDLAAALGEEARALDDAGAPIIQIDEPAWGRSPGDPALMVEALGRVFRGVRKAKRTLQISFGPAGESMAALTEAPIDVLGLDLVEGRSDLARLGALRGKEPALALGLFDARSTRLDDADDVISVIRGVIDTSGPRDLILTTNCGLEFLPRDRAQRKLAHLVAVARRAKEVIA
jgi:5-methyltetrahydropteroyltriglutamate--homocysteine methyltransferase